MGANTAITGGARMARTLIVPDKSEENTWLLVGFIGWFK
jgi:hypothetical protein